MHLGNTTVTLLSSCTSDHSLRVYDGTNTYCAETTTDTLTGALHVMHNGTPYSICNGACSGGGGTWVMPEEPEEPIVLPSSCTWTQTNENAYLLSDGNQYCEDNNSTMLVLKNDYTNTNNTQSGGIKLYRIRQWDSSGALIHDFQPVAQGTNVCGYTALTNAMWDSVTKKLYYPAGTSDMGYGVDP